MLFQQVQMSDMIKTSSKTQNSAFESFSRKNYLYVNYIKSQPKTNTLHCKQDFVVFLLAFNITKEY